MNGKEFPNVRFRIACRTGVFFFGVFKGTGGNLSRLESLALASARLKNAKKTKNKQKTRLFCRLRSEQENRGAHHLQEKPGNFSW